MWQNLYDVYKVVYNNSVASLLKCLYASIHNEKTRITLIIDYSIRDNSDMNIN